MPDDAPLHRLLLLRRRVCVRRRVAAICRYRLNGGLSGTFSFVGAERYAFSGSGNTSARFNGTSKILEIDIGGDTAADMEITMTGVHLADLDASDFTVT